MRASNRHITVWTVGHSTRTAEEFRALLGAYEIELLIDVRRYPGSRRVPHFGTEALARDLEAAGIAYCSIPELGGRRKVSPDSKNTGWRHPAFRGYADYVATEEFAQGFFELLMLASGLRSAIMCAELLWWRCHRRIIADVLVSLGFHVIDIRDAEVAEPHRLAPPARIVSGMLSYSKGR